MHQRTADVYALRALLYEHGHVRPAGRGHLDRVATLLEDEASDLPALIREECRDLQAQIAEKTARIIDRTTKLKMLAAQSDRARRLQTMPGVGPLTAFAMEAFGPDIAELKTGSAFAAWLGLVPKQHSSGGKEPLGRMTKAGQADIRRLLGGFVCPTFVHLAVLDRLVHIVRVVITRHRHDGCIQDLPAACDAAKPRQIAVELAEQRLDLACLRQPFGIEPHRLGIRPRGCRECSAPAT